MSRLAKTVVTERETFVRDLFRANLGLTGKEVQDKLKEKFNKMMRPNRIYELKHEVAKETLGTEPTLEVVEPLTAAESAGSFTPTPVSTNLTEVLNQTVGLMMALNK